MAECRMGVKGIIENVTAPSPARKGCGFSAAARNSAGKTQDQI
jgi:hypothetical protein